MRSRRASPWAGCVLCITSGRHVRTYTHARADIPRPFSMAVTCETNTATLTTHHSMLACACGCMCGEMHTNPQRRKNTKAGFRVRCISSNNKALRRACMDGCMRLEQQVSLLLCLGRNVSLSQIPGSIACRHCEQRNVRFRFDSRNATSQSRPNKERKQ
jgi:hypothetical protein